MIRRLSIVLGIAALTAGAAAFAHGDKPLAGRDAATPVVKEQKPWGIAGDAKDVSRTVELRMEDTMRFKPDRLNVRVGDTIRIVMHNDGKLMHELVIGTRRVLDEHAALMRKFPNMEHDEPYMAHVAPGKRGEIVWKFNRAGEFDFACLIAGHYEAGMVGKVTVAAR